ncbi:prepilin-type N-terminal cleavage/methylation domain-containing protein [Candidatus Dojkabacteria bacterium]|uniref:Prepilin-type N-terminal cleavage/methylation domain-containing protein n=1 Tax=Candidatus Dojkabacteria bacterium TaxID=2099670 RepID=A0A5C7J4W7_9BACT|nr:MAG: prepilin-type N-terminal cleavage/methylation domain-containing protein [Candidatus Dojkabacteria bacterium]
MEEKKDEIRSSIRSFFSLRMYSNNILFRSNYKLGRKNSLEKGFTFVELVVVIGIVGILTVATAALINPSLQLKRSRDADRKADLKNIQLALEIYRSDQGTYPVVTGTVAANCPTSSPSMLLQLESDGSCPVDPTKIYIQNISKDPKTRANYYYSSATGSTYTLYSCLENANDTEKLSASTVPALPDSATIAALACPSGTTAYYGVVNQ